MQFLHFDWLTGNGIWAHIPFTTNMVAKIRQWKQLAGELKYCNSVGFFNKTIILLALVGYEIVIANSYPTCACGIIVNIINWAILCPIQAPLSCDEPKYCQVSMSGGAGLEFSFTVRYGSCKTSAVLHLCNISVVVLKGCISAVNFSSPKGTFLNRNSA